MMAAWFRARLEVESARHQEARERWAALAERPATVTVIYADELEP